MSPGKSPEMLPVMSFQSSASFQKFHRDFKTVEKGYCT